MLGVAILVGRHQLPVDIFSRVLELAKHIQRTQNLNPDMFPHNTEVRPVFSALRREHPGTESSRPPPNATPLPATPSPLVHGAAGSADDDAFIAAKAALTSDRRNARRERDLVFAKSRHHSKAELLSLLHQLAVEIDQAPLPDVRLSRSMPAKAGAAGAVQPGVTSVPVDDDKDGAWETVSHRHQRTKPSNGHHHSARGRTRVARGSARPQRTAHKPSATPAPAAPAQPLDMMTALRQCGVRALLQRLKLTARELQLIRGPLLDIFVLCDVMPAQPYSCI